MSNFYVYVHKKLTDNSVFYVGRGTGKRHLSVKNRNNYWNNTVAKHGFLAEKIEENLTSDEANEREVFWIKNFRNLGSQLCNLTDGGGGLAGRARPELEKQKISVALTGVKKPDSMKQKMLGNKNSLGKVHSNEAKEKMSLAQKGKAKNEEHKNKISQALKGRPLSPEHRAKVVAAILARKAKQDKE